MYGYVYLTTNLITGNVYVGKKTSPTYVPSYLGSGVLLKEAVDIYGKQNFSNQILYIAESEEDLNNAEIYYINMYKSKFSNLCYNMAEGGNGGNVFKYSDDQKKHGFIEKMTKINKERCNTPEFKQQCSERMTKRYENLDERKAVSDRMKSVWKDPDYRKRRADAVKKHWEENKRDNSYNFKPCVIEFENGEYARFESVASLANFLKTKYNYTPDRRKFMQILENGANTIPFIARTKRQPKELSGALIYKEETLLDDEE